MSLDAGQLLGQCLCCADLERKQRSEICRMRRSDCNLPSPSAARSVGRVTKSEMLVWTFDLLADIIEFRGFFKINVMKSVGKQIEIMKKQ